MTTVDTSISLSIVILTALIHASFQLSISVLTLMSGHALGRKTAKKRLINLIAGYLFGASVMVILLLTFIAYLFGVLVPEQTPGLLWAIGCGGAIGVGISIWLFYYRDQLGTVLWIPRGFARHLDSRAKSTNSAAESFSLGLSSVLSETLFILAPVVIAALVLIRVEPDVQLLGILLYAGVALLPLYVISLLISSGHKISHIQKWREHNKRFLQFVAGSGLVILGAYVFVEKVVVVNMLGGY